MKLYKCDHCGKVLEDKNNLLSISVSNNSLSIFNKIGDNNLMLSNFDDFHFCTQECVNLYLFKTARKPRESEARLLFNFLTFCHKNNFSLNNHNKNYIVDQFLNLPNYEVSK